MTPRRREALALTGVGVAAAAAGGLAAVLVQQSGSGAAALLGATFSDLDGRPRRLLEWRGRALLCNFWATWCAPCREEIPLLIAAKQNEHPDGIEIVGIGIDSATKIREFAAIYRINYPLLIADASALTLLRALGNRTGGLPYTVALNAAGSLVRRQLGAFRGTELRQVLDSLRR